MNFSLVTNLKMFSAHNIKYTSISTIIWRLIELLLLFKWVRIF